MSGPGTASRSNARLGLALGGVVAGMVGLSYAAVPLYQLFCQVTGFGGTTQVATQESEIILDRDITVRFDANVSPGLAWKFAPATREVRGKVGETKLTHYRAENVGDTPLSGTATFNVTPLKAGIYFSKIECFCFTEQTLAPGESVEMPVTFYVDPAIAEDPGLDDVGTITLSYTFFPLVPDAPDRVQTSQARGTTPATAR